MFTLLGAMPKRCAYCDSHLPNAYTPIAAHCPCGALLPHTHPPSAHVIIAHCASCGKDCWAVLWEQQEINSNLCFSLFEIMRHQRDGCDG